MVARAVARRRREFAAGRGCAREALAELGVTSVAIPSNPDRTPAWPQGVVGSITHCRDYCAAAVCRRGTVIGIGIDVEDASPLEDALTDFVCTQSERERLCGLGSRHSNVWSKVLFSAKESFYKSYYPETKTFLGFHDVEVDLFPEEHRFVARLVSGDVSAPLSVRQFTGSFAVTKEHVFTMLTMSRTTPCCPV